MTEHQKLLTEKIGGDVIYYGRMEMLIDDSFEFNNTNEKN